MRCLASTLPWVRWCTCVCALLLPLRAAASERAVAADFDGDGRRDRATISAREPAVLRIWLSATRTTSILRSPEPVMYIASTDVDGDDRAELLASNGSAALRIWTVRHTRFEVVRPNQSDRPVGLGSCLRRALRGGAPTPPLNVDAVKSIQSALVLEVHPAGMPKRSACRHAAPEVRGPTSAPRLSPFAPRSPPLPSL